MPGLGRVRLSSVEAAEVDEELLDAMRHPAVCAHLHIPLQSGDPVVLRRMNRRYGPEEFLRAVELARGRLDRPALTTDVIVGFPGETDAAFENTAALCRAVRFSRLHVFPFSARPGTPAARMDGRVPAGAVRERARRARELGRELAAGWAQGFVGGQARVLFEERTPSGLLAGYTDRYVRLSAPGPADLAGRVVPAVCTARRGGALRGRLVASCH